MPRASIRLASKPWHDRNHDRSCMARHHWLGRVLGGSGDRQLAVMTNAEIADELERLIIIMDKLESEATGHRAAIQDIGRWVAQRRTAILAALRDQTGIPVSSRGATVTASQATGFDRLLPVVEDAVCLLEIEARENRRLRAAILKVVGLGCTEEQKETPFSGNI